MLRLFGGGLQYVKFKTGKLEECKESSLPSGYSLKFRWEEIDRRFANNRDL